MRFLYREGRKFLTAHVALQERDIALFAGNFGAKLCGPHLDGVAFVMEEDETARPIYTRFFGAVGVVFEANGVAHLVEQFFGGG